MSKKKPKGKEGKKSSVSDRDKNKRDVIERGYTTKVEVVQLVQCHPRNFTCLCTLYIARIQQSRQLHSRPTRMTSTISMVMSMPLASGSRMRLRHLVRAIHTSPARPSHENPLVCLVTSKGIITSSPGLGYSSSRPEPRTCDSKKRSTPCQIEDQGCTTYNHRSIR